MIEQIEPGGQQQGQDEHRNECGIGQPALGRLRCAQHHLRERIAGRRRLGSPHGQCELRTRRRYVDMDREWPGFDVVAGHEPRALQCTPVHADLAGRGDDSGGALVDRDPCMLQRDTQIGELDLAIGAAPMES